MSKEIMEQLISGVMDGNTIERVESTPIEEPEIENTVEEKIEESKAPIVAKEEIKIEQPKAEQKEVVEAYIPNYKYNVKDKEFELDEKARKYIKSKEDEDFFRDVYTKNAGLDEIKLQRDKLREEHAGLSKQVQGLDSKAKSLDYLENTLAAGRYDEFMSTLQRAGLSGKELVRFAHSVAQALEKNPDQVERERLEYEHRQKEHELSSHRSESEDKYEKLNQQLFETRVEMATSRPEIAAIAKQYNDKFGNGITGKGAFMDEIAKEGILYYQQRGEVADPAIIVDAVAKRIGSFVQPAPQNAGTPKPAIKTKTIISANKNLPNVGSGSNVSAIGKSNMTVEQLEKHFEQELARRR